MSPTVSPETGQTVLTAFADVCADGAALGLGEGLGSAAKALIVHTAVRIAINRFCILSQFFGW